MHTFNLSRIIHEESLGDYRRRKSHQRESARFTFLARRIERTNAFFSNAALKTKVVTL
jgi:hypothetical protein